MGSEQLEPVLIDRLEGFAYLTLNRPKVGSTIDVTLAQGLLEALISVGAGPQVQCGVRRSQGPMFFVGGDINAFHQPGDALPGFLTQILQSLHRESFGSQPWPSRLSRRLSAQEAADIDLVTRVMGEGAVSHEVDAVARSILAAAAASTGAVIKQLLVGNDAATLQRHLDAGRAAIVSQRYHGDCKAASVATLGGREPSASSACCLTALQSGGILSRPSYQVYQY